MIKLQNLLTETINNTELTVDEVVELLKSDFSHAYELWKNNTRFYRGAREKYEFYITYPSRGERMSRDSSNFYTVMCGHLPSWEGWPKRSHSLIMTNSESVADKYNSEVFVVFPKNDAKIVASTLSNDILKKKSWPYMDKFFGINELIDIDKVISYLMGIIDYYHEYANTQEFRKYKKNRGVYRMLYSEYEMVLSDLQKNTNVKSLKKALLISKDQYQLSAYKILKAFVKTKDQHGLNWEKFLSNVMDPVKNKFVQFKLEDTLSVRMIKGAEMWTESDCLMIKKNLLKKLDATITAGQPKTDDDASGGEQLKNLVTEGGKLFGTRSERVSTDEMLQIFKELETKLQHSFSQFRLSKHLPSKTDHGDIDIVVQHDTADIQEILENQLGNGILDYSKNGNITSILYRSISEGKTVHVDFIVSIPEKYDAQYDYLSYNDFSGILGIIARKLHFNYGSEGFFKIYNDKSGKNNYILLTYNLREGLVIMGYKKVLSDFDKIQNIQDIIDFISSSDLFDSKYLESFGMSHSDRKRSRASRPTARAIRDGLLKLNKSRTIEDDNYFLKIEYPQYYQKLRKEIQKIETAVIQKSKYGGNWIMQNFPDIKPGPIINAIKLYWKKLYGDHLDDVSEEELKKITSKFLQSIN